MNLKKITAGALVALAAMALIAVVAANPFSTQASSTQVAETTQPQTVEHLQAVEDEDTDQDAQTRPFIGIVISPLSPARAEELGVDGGALVARVLDDGPSSGVLEPGDVITSISGQSVSGPQDVVDAVTASSVGDVISVIVIRDGDSLDLSITVGETAISKRNIFKHQITQKRMPDLTQGIIQQALTTGDRFARGEVVIADEDGNYQTHRAVVGTVTEVDSDAGTFTLQPKDGSDPISYTISEDTKVNLNRAGDLGELNTEDTTLVVDVDGEVKLVHQGKLPKPVMKGKMQSGNFGIDIRIHRGQGGQPGKGFGKGFGSFNSSGMLDRIHDRISSFSGGPGQLGDILPPQFLERLGQLEGGAAGHGGFLDRICDQLDMEDLPDGIIIQCESSGNAPAVPSIDDNSL